MRGPIRCPRYVAICILVTQFIVRPISRATFALNAAEGTFRFVWARIKEFAEVICLYNGQRDEEARADAVFDRMYFKFFRLYGWQMLLNFVSFFTSYAATSMCFLVIAYIIHTDGSIEGQPINTATVNSSVSAFQVRCARAMRVAPIALTVAGGRPDYDDFAHGLAKHVRPVAVVATAATCTPDDTCVGGAFMTFVVRAPDTRSLALSLALHIEWASSWRRWIKSRPPKPKFKPRRCQTPTLMPPSTSIARWRL